MANPEQLALLMQGVARWNRWRKENPRVAIDLQGAELASAKLRGVDLFRCNLRGANLTKAHLSRADFYGADLRGAMLREAKIRRAKFEKAQLGGADLCGADLRKTDFRQANLSKANLTGANLQQVQLVETQLHEAILTNCNIYGISAWGVQLEGAQQFNLIVTPPHEPAITVDHIEIAQFVYLLLHNEKIRDVINTVGRKGVLLLGRFSERKDVLEALRSAVRQRGYVPIVFDFEKPTDRDFTETVMTLAGMCVFILADITKPHSVPLELQATIPNYMIPFLPLLQEGEQPFSMFVDLWHKYREWVLEPLVYDSVAGLIDVFDQAVLAPVTRRRAALQVKKAETLRPRHVTDYRR